MSLTQTTITKALRDRGLRVTPQRFAVYANLLNRQDHPSAEEILSDLNRTAPTSSQATVYSSLKALLGVKLIREVLLEEGVCRYDANVNPHHHFCCNGCGKITDIPWEQFSPLALNQIPTGLQVKEYEITLRGYCPSCQGKLDTSNS